MSFAEFNARYGIEEQCHAALVAMRWPDGFQCPKCGCRTYSYAKARRHFQCSACRVQTSAKAGTIFHKSKTPLTKWFLAMHLITSAKNDISGLELARQLDVKWDTAWLMKQKLMEVMRAACHPERIWCEPSIESGQPVRSRCRGRLIILTRPPPEMGA